MNAIVVDKPNIKPTNNDTKPTNNDTLVNNIGLWTGGFC